jgi:hypothetical protein
VALFTLSFWGHAYLAGIGSTHLRRELEISLKDASGQVTESSLESCCASLHSVPAPTTRGLSAINLYPSICVWVSGVCQSYDVCLNSPLGVMSSTPYVFQAWCRGSLHMDYCTLFRVRTLTDLSVSIFITSSPITNTKMRVPSSVYSRFILDLRSWQ